MSLALDFEPHSYYMGFAIKYATQLNSDYEATSRNLRSNKL